MTDRNDLPRTPIHPTVTIGTRVRYSGSVTEYHGEYYVTAVMDKDRLEQMGRSIDHYQGGVGYELTPISGRGRWEDTLYCVRRTSFTIINADDAPTEELPVTVTVEDIAAIRRMFDDNEFVYAVGSDCVPKFERIFDIAEEAIRNA